MILRKQKVVETRNSPTLRPYIGKRVGIIRTFSNKKAVLVGYVDVVAEKIYKSRKEFDADAHKHWVGSDSVYYFKKVKYGYLLANPIRIVSPKQVFVKSKGHISRVITN